MYFKIIISTKQNILFIINPISGVGKQKLVEKLIDIHLDSTKFNVDIKYTKRAKHAIKISSNNLTNYGIIVAVGGDGSVNEVGKSLINTNTTLAIIPVGSGNGLARDLKIPINICKAISLINNGKTQLIDTIKINNDYFLGTAGIGFDSYISWKFEEASTRGFWTYLKIALKGFLKYKPLDYPIIYDDNKKTISKGFLVTFSNSKQYGNNIYISPNSIIDDGFVRLIVVRKFPLIYFPVFVYYLLSKKIHKFKFTEEFKSKKLTVINPEKRIHIDGEPIEMDNKLEIEVIHKSLKVLVP
ncbi:MAG: YegS/Rv2252/BmrU family lipid kinase [Flavobacteriales bacterium]|nr:YegS/Rv2252/BmrU family lipid kinase [Flavobacteriales bacterium]